MPSSSIPEIRFAEFSAEWEERKLRNFVQDYVEKTSIQNQYPVLTSSQKYGITYQEDYFADRQITTESNIGYFVLPRGYFTFRSRSDNGVFKFNRNDLVDKGIISYFYPVFKISNGNSDFFLYMLNSTIKRQVVAQAEGTGQRVLSLNKFKSINVVVPKIQEQIQIGTFFRQLDDIITFHQQEINTLQQTKQGFLQKLFPKEGESVPEVRFAGFTGEWEERKLGDLANFSKGNGYSKSDVIDEGNPIILYGRLYKQYETVIESIDTFALKKENSVISEGNEVIVPSSGESAEDIARASAVCKRGIILGGDLNIVRPSKEIDPVFLALTISSGRQQKELSKLAQGKSIVHLHNSDLKKVNLVFPKREEQIQIGIFFKQLDDRITIHQRELEILQQTKKAFLQKMFV
ncbi:type I restriction enzyme, S subunit [Thermoactinomyces sp. DSM 45891]|uniref:restriction endonuclease subunit S n=1 Tax=Thermoactinomyces sp. DSM 45891 TaxID=1761907 RepID=UPI00091FF4A3|nr:restriction endonuclease subunit S [Thermoactinomyces sp. DSM 45891]SFX73952.1 type I restriction enzyme, S subunit [Thermoactinomyces sp. DSM 45891]